MTTMDVRPMAAAVRQQARQLGPGQPDSRGPGDSSDPRGPRGPGVSSGLPGMQGLATGFGSVAVVEGLRLRHPGRPAGYDGEWPELVRVEVVLRNVTVGDVAVSVEQFRLRGCGRRQAVTPHVWGLRGGYLSPGSTTRTWVDFWASGVDGEPWVEFHENRRDAPLAFAVVLTSLT